jgi:hypothetical protein
MTTNYHGIKVKYLPATNSHGTRLVLTSSRFACRKVLPYNYGTGGSMTQGIEWLKAQGFEIIGTTEVDNRDIILSTTFKPF